MYVGVSGINAVDNPGPGIAVARSLKQDATLGVRIVGLAYDAMEPGVYMDWVVDKSFLMPYPSGSGEDFLDRLSHIKTTHGLDFVIPNLDSELPLYIKYAERLRERGIDTVLPDAQQFRLRGKDVLVDFAERLAVRVPDTELVTAHDMLPEMIERIGLPLMVKGCFYKAFRAYTQAEAVAYTRQLVAEWGYPVVLQKIVTGDELNVVGLGDGQGNTLGLVAIKKAWVTSLGKMWTGVTVKHAGMLAAAERFVRLSRWRGPFELECIVDGEGVYLIEINPRFPAWVYAATQVGLNLPARLVRHARGESPPTERDYPAGKLFIRYSYDLVTDMTTFQNMATQGENP